MSDVETPAMQIEIRINIGIVLYKRQCKTHTFSTIGGHEHSALLNVSVQIVTITATIWNLIVSNKINFMQLQKIVCQRPRCIWHNLNISIEFRNYYYYYSKSISKSK